jgi:hypothetical protein
MGLGILGLVLILHSTEKDKFSGLIRSNDDLGNEHIYNCILQPLRKRSEKCATALVSRQTALTSFFLVATPVCSSAPRALQIGARFGGDLKRLEVDSGAERMGSGDCREILLSPTCCSVPFLHVSERGLLMPVGYHS